jgi:hypothetical protein
MRRHPCSYGTVYGYGLGIGTERTRKAASAPACRRQARCASWQYRGGVIDVPAAAVTRALAAATLAVALVAPAGSPTASASTGSAPSVASYRLEAEYDADLHLDWDTRQVRVRTTIAVRNVTPSPVKHLDLNTVVARMGGMRRLRVSVDGVAVHARASGQTIGVPLVPPLEAGGTRTVRVAFRARLRTTSAARTYFFTKVRGVAQLYRVIPWLSRAIPFSSQGHGEPFLTPVTPRVEVTLSADRKLVWATSGRRVRRDGPRTETHRAFDVRDFVIIASPGYHVTRGTSRDGQTDIVAYTRHASGRHWIDLARAELRRYENVSGVPYPYPAYRLAESTAGLAMEAPALTWIPDTRGPADHPFLISHETAHQWWYGMVGNDQARSAFADEAMADYFSRKARSSIRRSLCTRDRLDREIRSYSSRCYYEVIYVQGALFLDQLRRDFGDRPFRRAVRAYTKANHLGIGSNKRLLEAFRAEIGDKVLKRFRARFPTLY